MPTDPAIQEVNQIILELFEVNADLIHPEASLKNDLNIDSLDSVDFIVALEKHFGVRIEEARAKEMTHLKHVYEYIVSCKKPS